MYFKSAREVGYAVSQMMESIYNKQHLIKCENDQQIKMEFRIYAGNDKEVHAICILQDYMVWYTISDKPTCHMSKEELAALVFVEDDDKKSDYYVRARGSRRYIFGDLVAEAVQVAVSKAMEDNEKDDTAISLFDTFPVEIQSRQVISEL